MHYGLSDQQLQLLAQAFAHYTPIEEVILFGSRATGHYKAASDLDLALKGTHVDDTLLYKLREHLEAEPLLPFDFDLLAYPAITHHALRTHLQQQGIVLYRKGWRRVKLGEVANIKNGKSNAQDAVEKGIYPLFDRSLQIKRSMQWLFDNEAIIVPGEGKAFIPRYYQGKFDIHQRCYAVYNFINDANPRFVYYHILANASHFKSVAVGSTVMSLRLGHFLEYPIHLPPLPEQQAIAGVLSSLDDKIDLLERQNTTLEALAQTLFRQWFIEERKEEWEERKLGDLVNILSGFAFRSATFKRHGKYRLVTIKNVQDGYLDLNKTSYLQEVPKKMPDYCLLQEGDMLLSLTGNVGRCCLVKDKNLLLNQRVAKIHPIKGRNWAFVYTLFRKPSMQVTLQDMAKGTAQANLSPIETARMRVKIPPADFLHKFSKYGSPLLERVLKNQSQIRTLTHLRDTLLPRLISGAVRVGNGPATPTL